MALLYLDRIVKVLFLSSQTEDVNTQSIHHSGQIEESPAGEADPTGLAGSTGIEEEKRVGKRSLNTREGTGSLQCRILSCYCRGAVQISKRQWSPRQ